jgi:putative tryptophan/tyrosine transport system substrate-binding protein
MQRTTRREFVIAAAALAAAPLVRAQAPVEKRSLGILSPHPKLKPEEAARLPYGARFKQLGWTFGKDLFIERPEDPAAEAALPAMAQALVRKRVDAIWAFGPEAALAAARATRTIPIVFWGVPYPVEQGLIRSFGRPGGNVTGVAFFAGAELVTKVLETFRQIAPQVYHIAALFTPSASSAVDGTPYAAPLIVPAAERLGFDYRTYNVANARDIDAALAAAVTSGAQGIAAWGTTTTFRERHRIAEFANRHRLVSGSSQEEFVEAGCLFAYGANTRKTILQTMVYVDKVLRGANPADLPVERPERYELAVNLSTAKLLQLAIPQNVLLRADRVIE